MSTENQSAIEKITPSDVLSTIDGIPLPPAVKKSLWKAIGSLITGLVDVPLAKLEARSQQTRSEANALSLVTKAASEAAAGEFGKDKELVNRSVNHFASKLLKEQTNRESIFEKTLNDLKENPPKEDTTNEVDTDWLEMFSRVAETKTNEDVQLFLSKLLSGEIRKPGSFSLKTIQVLSTLDEKTAKIFQSFCDVSLSLVGIENKVSFVVTSPFGSAGGNSLKAYNLGYTNLTILQDAGLIKYDLESTVTLPKLFFSVPVIIGRSIHIYKPNEVSPENIRIDCVNFTQAGLELKGVLHTGNVDEYNDIVFDWIGKQLSNITA